MSTEREVVCVTGASGCIGSWLVHLLLHRGYSVHATVKNLRNLYEFISSIKPLVTLSPSKCHKFVEFLLQRTRKRRNIWKLSKVQPRASIYSRWISCNTTPFPPSLTDVPVYSISHRPVSSTKSKIHRFLYSLLLSFKWTDIVHFNYISICL